MVPVAVSGFRDRARSTERGRSGARRRPSRAFRFRRSPPDLQTQPSVSRRAPAAQRI